jgi:hypothetical protein
VHSRPSASTPRRHPPPAPPNTPHLARLAPGAAEEGRSDVLQYATPSIGVALAHGPACANRRSAIRKWRADTPCASGRGARAGGHRCRPRRRLPRLLLVPPAPPSLRAARQKLAAPLPRAPCTPHTSPRPAPSPPDSAGVGRRRGAGAPPRIARRVRRTWRRRGGDGATRWRCSRRRGASARDPASAWGWRARASGQHPRGSATMRAHGVSTATTAMYGTGTPARQEYRDKDASGASDRGAVSGRAHLVTH